MTNLILVQIDWFSKSYAKFLKNIGFSTIKKIFILKTNIVIKTSNNRLVTILLFLKNHSLCLYKQLIDIAAEDTPKHKNRFRLNYILSSILYNHRVIVSLNTNELTYLPSVTKIFSSAGWLEREVWDLYGIFFTGNTDLRRILTDYGFSGHPLRKDFPLTGFHEIYYSLEKKRILTEPVELAQEYRIFTL